MLDFWKSTQEEETMADKRENAKTRYDKKNTKMFGLKLNLKTDADVIRKLESIENKQGYIKALIRADIAGGSPTTKGDVLAKLYSIASAVEDLDI